MFEFLEAFWRKYPALLYGLSFFLGSIFSLERSWLIIFPLFVIWCPLFTPKKVLFIRLFLAFLLLVGSFFYVTRVYNLPEIPKEGVVGEGIFEIASLSSSKTHFGSLWVFKGTLKNFGGSPHIPVRITLTSGIKISRPLANCHYLIRGRLKMREKGNYFFCLDKITPWKPVKGTFSFAESRYQAKKWVSNQIRKRIFDQRSARFLSGIATGDFDDPLMQYEFSRFGLQHIMAISGFHFAIIASILSFGLKFLFSRKTSNLFLIFLLSSYFLFLGCGPSILRAWLTISIALGGFILEKKGNGLNSLGIALLFSLLYEPFFCKNVGFQFSFIATAAILLLYPLCDQFLQSAFTSRPLSQMVTMDFFNQHGYLVLIWFRKALSLTFAVNLATLPLILFYFHKFPFLCLVYNLFFPFLVSVSMLLLLLGLIFPPLNSLNNIFTGIMLDFTYNMPPCMDYLLRVPDIPTWFVILHLCLVFSAAAFLEHKRVSFLLTEK